MGRFSIVFILALLTSVEASANPMWVEQLKSSAEDGPHVMLIYRADKAKAGAQPPALGCHGTYCSPWQADEDTSGNTGSGVKDLISRHMCDCYVPTETDLKYAPADSYTSTSVTVPAQYQRAPEPGSPCKVECEQAAPAGGAGRADALPEGTTDPKTEGAGGGSCTFAPTGRQATLPLLAFLVGLIVFWRRRS